jgi:hypothetical protein
MKYLDRVEDVISHTYVLKITKAIAFMRYFDDKAIAFMHHFDDLWNSF